MYIPLETRLDRREGTKVRGRNDFKALSHKYEKASFSFVIFFRLSVRIHQRGPP